MRFEVIALHLNHILFVLLCPLREQTCLIKFINRSVFARKKNILINTFIQNKGKERYGEQMIKDFTNILNFENKLCWMLSWHKNKYFTGKQKYFLSRHEVHLYFTELRRMCSYSLIFMLNQTQEGWIYSTEEVGAEQEMMSFSPLAVSKYLRNKKNQRRKDTEREQRQRWVKGWLDVSHRHEGNKQWRMRGFRTEPLITVIIFPLTVKTVSSVPGVQHQWVRRHTCFHRVSTM